MSDSLYDTNFYLWTQRMAEIIRQGRWDELDRNNVVDEIESLGFRNKRTTEQHLSWLVTQLTLWWARPERRCGKWTSRILERRFKLADIFDDSPSLRNGLSDVIAELSPMAVEKAVIAARLGKEPLSRGMFIHDRPNPRSRFLADLAIERRRLEGIETARA